jgi:hypothetical protein
VIFLRFPDACNRCVKTGGGERYRFSANRDSKRGKEGWVQIFELGRRTHIPA